LPTAAGLFANKATKEPETETTWNGEMKWKGGAIGSCKMF